MEMAMATLIGTFFFVKTNCTDPCNGQSINIPNSFQAFERRDFRDMAEIFATRPRFSRHGRDFRP